MILSTGGGCLVPGECLPPGGGAWSRGGGAWSWGGPGGDPSGTATAAGGTHPTGIHSCFYISCLSPDLQYFIMLYCSVELRHSNSRRTKWQSSNVFLHKSCYSTSILCEYPC